MKQRSDYKVVVVIPAGRERFLSILIPALLKQEVYFDELRLFVNTNVESDISYMRSLNHPKITLDYRPNIILRKTPGKNMIHSEAYNNYAIHELPHKCIDPDTIYIRVDDDVIWISDDFVKSIVETRINSNAFLVFGNIINNAVIDSIHQDIGALKWDNLLECDCFHYESIHSIPLLIAKHEQFLNHLANDNLSVYSKIIKRILPPMRVSVNAICWFGSEFRKFDGRVFLHEEEWLSKHKPKKLGRYNEIAVNALCVHYSFHTQQGIDDTDIYQRYKELVVIDS